jgi:uncharacterized repeat protein (TIGR03803 family)
MQRKKCSIGLAVAILTVTLLVAGASAVAQEQVLYDFNLNKYGATPYGALITDGAGNLYGTASEGGPSDHTGTAFELVKPATGKNWGKPKVLHSFSDTDSAKNGAEPYAALISDASGNLYGTTHIGGEYGDGTVFELVRPTTGTAWKCGLLHSFDNNGTDGSEPAYANLLLDSAGNLYGTTYYGGANNAGVVFELVKPTTGKIWKESILHTFNNPADGTDGANPSAGLAFDGSGNLYGTTTYGDTNGLYNAGTVFELSPNGSGGWNESVLYSFGSYSTDGVFPYSGLTVDTIGNLYGTTSQGGTGGGTGIGPGTVFELSFNGGEGWTESLLHSFSNNGTDGFEPYSGVVLDTATGKLYGTTPGGGTYMYGAVYEVTP